jgi:hypothetical protein
VRIAKRFARWMFGPLLKWSARSWQKSDPWERLAYASRPEAFGSGSIHPFPWYFEGESAVDAKSLDDICAWLMECTYVRDPELFNEPDFWQHPRTFERLRQGDCEDHAIWAWRKLVELGLDAELVSGIWQPPACPAGKHAWVRFRQDGREYIFEAVERTPERIVRAFDDAKSEYVPHAGVDREFRQHTYMGYLQTLE